jgi:hypothetical protein
MLKCVINPEGKLYIMKVVHQSRVAQDTSNQYREGKSDLGLSFPDFKATVKGTCEY